MELKCPSTDEWIKKMWYTHTHTHACAHTHTHTHTHTQEYYSAIKKNETLPFATTCMDPESKRIQSEKDKYHMISLICGI